MEATLFTHLKQEAIQLMKDNPEIVSFSALATRLQIGDYDAYRIWKEVHPEVLNYRLKLQTDWEETIIPQYKWKREEMLEPNDPSDETVGSYFRKMKAGLV